MIDLFQILNSLAGEQYLPFTDRVRMFMNILFGCRRKGIEDKEGRGWEGDKEGRLGEAGDKTRAEGFTWTNWEKSAIVIGKTGQKSLRT